MSAPNFCKIWRRNVTSLKMGTFLKTHGRSVNNAAESISKAAFLDPDTRTVPANGYPPRILTTFTTVVDVWRRRTA
jgi:hypothetical protein